MTLIGFSNCREPYVMTRAGPAHSTLQRGAAHYQEGFRWWNMGYAAAVPSCCF